MLTLPRGRVIEKVRVTPQMTSGWLKYIAPTIAEATRTEGTLSLELEGRRAPAVEYKRRGNWRAAGDSLVGSQAKPFVAVAGALGRADPRDRRGAGRRRRSWDETRYCCR